MNANMKWHPDRVTLAILQTGRILDVWLPWKILAENIPGLSVGIEYQGKLLYQTGFGFADVEKKIRATSETRYRIASISKTFTAVAILQLVEQGKIQLDDNIERYVPWFRIKNKHGSSKNITLRQLLSHTSGLLRDGATDHWISDDFPTIQELQESVKNDSIIFSPGEKFKYSNFGFALLGEAIQCVSGVSYDEYVRRSIIDVLNLKNTASDVQENEIGHLALGYERFFSNEDRQSVSAIPTRAYASATGYISNVSDLLAYLSALSFSESALLSPRSKRFLSSIQTERIKEDASYGLGVEMVKVGKGKIIGHVGAFAGFAAYVGLEQKRDIGVVVLANTHDCWVQPLVTGIFQMIYQSFDEAVSTRSQTTPLENDSHYEGLYRSRWDDKLIVSYGKNFMAFNPTSNSPLKDGMLLRRMTKDRFVIETDAPFDSNGEVAEFDFQGKKTAQTLLWGTELHTRVKTRKR